MHNEDMITDAVNNASADINAALATVYKSGVIHAVGLEIVIGSMTFSHYHSFSLQQTAGGHHTFRLVLAHDVLSAAQDHTVENAQDFLGAPVSVTFRYRNVLTGSPERRFKGVIAQVGFTQEHGSLGRIVLDGSSPGILLDAAPHVQSFTDTSLQSLAENVISEGLTDRYAAIAVKTSYTGNLLYTCQYNETHYNYLARMAAAYGEWFYYDGDTLHFGKPALPDPLRLIYGRDVRQVETRVRSGHINRQHYGYNSSSNLKLAAGKTDAGGLGDMGMAAYESAAGMYKTPSLQIAPIRAVTDHDVETTQKGAVGSEAAGLFIVTGSTSIPFLYPGCLVEMNFRKPESNDAKYFSRLIVISVSHHVDARGDYYGSFEAIPSDTEYLPQPYYITPEAQPQIAIVKDNKDPQGRVKVQFDWQRGGETTDFIRVMAPDAGSSGPVNKNRGFVFVPEVGDQVMVGFVHNHPDRPFVMGGMFHGNTGAGGGDGNNVKSIRTRSGHTIRLSDKQGEEHIVIMDGKKRNIVELNTEKEKLYITSSGDIEMEAENINMHARNNIIIKAANDIQLSSEKTQIILQAEKLISIRSQQNNIELNARETISVQAKTLDGKIKGDTTVKADGNITMQSSGKAALKSTETSIEGAAHKLKIS
ncbi:type VI secretion system Vgr family protein [Chitinophagaceae bacterium MMS25-I14]